MTQSAQCIHDIDLIKQGRSTKSNFFLVTDTQVTLAVLTYASPLGSKYREDRVPVGLLGGYFAPHTAIDAPMTGWPYQDPALQP